MKRIPILTLMIFGIVLLPNYLNADVIQAQDSIVKEESYIPEISQEKPTLVLPFNTTSNWISADNNIPGINLETKRGDIRFALENGKFIPTNSEDTWFVYGWFGYISAIQEDYNIKYPQWGNRHNGIDFAGKTGLDIISACEGQVIFSGNKIGNTVIIDAGNGYKITYGHLADIAVEVGDTVKTNEIIGHLGNSGTINPHLHFEVDKYVNNQRIAVNPLTLMNVDWDSVLIPTIAANTFYSGSQNPIEQDDFVW